jgi:hypothetical protein
MPYSSSGTTKLYMVLTGGTHMPRTSDNPLETLQRLFVLSSIVLARMSTFMVHTQLVYKENKWHARLKQG